MTESEASGPALFEPASQKGPKVAPNGADRAQINLRYLAAASLFASKEETRYYLNGVYIEVAARSCTYVATDGHRLIAVRQEHLLSDADNTLIGGFIIPTPHCKAFKLAKEGPVEAVASGAPNRLTLSFDGVDVSFSPIDGTFPDWRKVVPSQVVQLKAAHFDYKLLADFKKFADALGYGHPALTPDGIDKPALVWFPGNYEALGVMMPLRNEDESGRSVPDWASAASRPDFAPQHDEDGVIFEPPGDPEERTTDLSGTEVDVSGMSPGMAAEVAKRARAAGARVVGDAA